MGDRGNIVIEQENGDRIFLYSHWNGSELPLILQDALSRGKSRWTDESYLARIIFCEMVRDDIEGTTSFGISTYPPDNEYPFLIVNCKHKKIQIAKDNKDMTIIKDCNFEDYIKLNKSELINFRSQ